MKTQMIQNLPTYTQVEKKRNKCTIIQFPNRKAVHQTVTKVPSMSCCKAQMMDWDFTRGY